MFFIKTDSRIYIQFCGSAPYVNMFPAYKYMKLCETISFHILTSHFNITLLDVTESHDIELIDI